MGLLQVTAASGLNIRKRPESTAERLAAMPLGMRVERMDDVIWAGKWYRIRAHFRDDCFVEGYSVERYLRPVIESTGIAGEPERASPPEASGAQPDAGLLVKELLAAIPSFALESLRPLSDVLKLRSYEEELHEVFLHRVRDLLDRCKRHNLKFKLFEAYRTPDRQAHLFSQSRSGKRVTNADAWQSIHNYGLAADIILDVPGVNPWETGTVGGVNYGKKWDKMRALARKAGLATPLSWDLPHVEMPGCPWRKMNAGEFPPGGGAIWTANLLRNIEACPRNAPSNLGLLYNGGAALTTSGESTPVPPAPASPREPALAPPSPPPAAETVETRAEPGNGPTLEVVIQAVPADVVAGFFHPTARSNVEENLPLVLEALHAEGLSDWPFVIFALGTINAETASFRSIPEGQSKYNTAPGERPFGLYDFREDLGNGAVGDGARYKGRGFIQLTGKANYKKYGDYLKIDLENDPDLALEPRTAASILAAFLAASKTRLQDAWGAEDWQAARKVVNGGTHGLDRFEHVVLAARQSFDWKKPMGPMA